MGLSSSGLWLADLGTMGRGFAKNQIAGHGLKDRLLFRLPRTQTHGIEHTNALSSAAFRLGYSTTDCASRKFYTVLKSEECRSPLSFASQPVP